MLSNILFLLGLQGQFNEDLLKLLVDVVDAELRSQQTNLVILAQAISFCDFVTYLFEAVVLEDFETTANGKSCQ